MWGARLRERPRQRLHLCCCISSPISLTYCAVPPQTDSAASDGLKATAWILLPLLIALFFLIGSPAFGEDLSPGEAAPSSPEPPSPPGIFSIQYVERTLDDAMDLARSPARWERREWLTFAGVAAVTGGLFFFDERIKENVQEHQSSLSRSLANSVRDFGSTYAFATLGLFYAGGTILKDERAYAVAADGLEASALAGAITQTLKYAVGRDRPSDNKGADRFLPFRFSPSGESHNSFPSGHSTEAFAVASVVAARYDSLWIESAAYGLAGLVGWARVNENAHFASDVVAGAAIGTWVGRSIVHRHTDRQGQQAKNSILLLPFPGGIAVRVTF